MIFIAILLLFQCTSLTNVKETLERNDVNINYSLINNNITKLSFPNKVKLGKISYGTLEVSEEIFDVKIISSKGNKISLDGNQITYESVNNAIADMVTVTFVKADGTKVTEHIEVRIAKKVDICLGIYGAADNDLNGGAFGYNASGDYLKRDLDELTSTEIPSNVGIAILIDRRAAADEAYKDSHFDTAGLYIIEDNQVIKVIGESDIVSGDLNMGDQKVLIFLLNAMYDYFDADKNVLDLWSHGFSIFGVGFDEGAYEDSIEPLELKNAIETSKLKELDVLLFSACLMMDIGVLGYLDNCVKASIGSADYVPGDGNFYGNSREKGVVSSLALNHRKTPFEIAKELCDVNFKSYSNAYQQQQNVSSFLTYSAVDHSKLTTLKSAMKEFFDNTSLKGNNLSKQVKQQTVFYGAHSYQGTNYEGYIIDLGSLLFSLKELSSGTSLDKANLLLTNLANCTFAKHARTEEEFNTSHLGIGAFNPYYSDYGFYKMRTNTVYDYTGWNKFMNV